MTLLYAPLFLQVQTGNFEEESLHTVDCIDLSDVTVMYKEQKKDIACSKYIPRPDHAGECIKKRLIQQTNVQSILSLLLKR
jgi:hypothetical protein